MTYIIVNIIYRTPKLCLPNQFSVKYRFNFQILHFALKSHKKSDSKISISIKCLKKKKKKKKSRPIGVFFFDDAPSYLSSNFIFTSSIHSQGTRSLSFNTLVLPSWYNNSGKCTFQYRGALKWNTLLSDIIFFREILTILQFELFFFPM